MAVNLEQVRWAVETLRWIKDRKAELKATEEAARDAIEQALGDSDEGELDGHVVIAWKSFKRNALDQTFLRDTYPELYESAKRVTEVRRFTLVEDDQW
jgi:predicted phage-related endonuclease